MARGNGTLENLLILVGIFIVGKYAYDSGLLCPLGLGDIKVPAAV